MLDFTGFWGWLGGTLHADVGWFTSVERYLLTAWEGSPTFLQAHLFSSLRGRDWSAFMKGSLLMWAKVTVIGCLFLTAVVVHTAVRIEHVNHRMGTFLPRAPGYEQENWSVPELDRVMNFVKTQIAKQRSNTYSNDHPGEEIPPTESFLGEPYSEKEQGFIDRHKRDYATFQELHWWVYSFGALQYGLAPIAFLWSVGNVLALKKLNIRLISSICAGLAFCAIFLMIFRGY